jgi:peroxiredoxin Q/BCP
MVLEIGKKAPAFTLEDHNGKKVRLADLKGKWVILYFYPKDDTPGCTLEGIEFTKLLPEFTKLGAEIYGISGDKKESHCNFIEKHKLSVTLLSDPDKKMMERYDAFKEKFLYGKSFLGIIRSTVIVDPEGKVAHHWKKANARDHAAQVLKRLEQLQS